MNTLWRINDCQSLLKDRVNQQYVQKALQIHKKSIKGELQVLQQLLSDQTQHLQFLTKTQGTFDQKIEDTFQKTELFIQKQQFSYRIQRIDKERKELEQNLLTQMKPVDQGDEYSLLNRQIQEISYKFNVQLSKKADKQTVLSLIQEIKAQKMVKPVVRTVIPPQIYSLQRFQKEALQKLKALQSKINTKHQQENFKVLKKSLSMKSDIKDIQQIEQTIEDRYRQCIQMNHNLRSQIEVIACEIENLKMKRPNQKSAKSSLVSQNGCLACGKEVTSLESIMTVQGSDKKVYKTDALRLQIPSPPVYRDYQSRSKTSRRVIKPQRVVS